MATSKRKPNQEPEGYHLQGKKVKNTPSVSESESTSSVVSAVSESVLEPAPAPAPDPKSAGEVSKSSADEWTVDLPETVFSVFPIEVREYLKCANDPSTDKKDYALAVFKSAQYFLVMVLALVMQFFFLRQLEVTYSKKSKEKICDEQVWLQLSAFVIFLANVWGDVWESFKFFVYFCYKDKKSSPFFSFIVFCFIIVPKVYIAYWLLGVGCEFLMHSDDETEVIMNCTALFFIIEIDDIFFESMCPDEVKDRIEEDPGVKITEKTYFAGLPFGWFMLKTRPFFTLSSTVSIIGSSFYMRGTYCPNTWGLLKEEMGWYFGHVVSNLPTSVKLGFVLFIVVGAILFNCKTDKAASQPPKSDTKNSMDARTNSGKNE